MSADPTTAIPFYQALLGWQVEAFPVPNEEAMYHMFSVEGINMGGFMADPSPNRPSAWVSYVNTPDVAASMQKNEALGGKTLIPAFQIETVGQIGLCADPMGAPFWAATWDTPYVPQRPVYGCIMWHEYQGKNAVEALAYYQEMFGWTTGQTMDVPGGVYHIFQIAGQDAGGFFQSEEALPFPNNWLPYVYVQDLDGLQQKTEELGGLVAVPPTAIPGGGKFMVILDPQQAMLGLLTD